ncbi:hypothetical protein FB106_1053 [Synechococcus sp. Ace-Pa]|nr:hypothetical protein FB106_1053 [Synechococcus sp. Ace-Pa]
MTFQITQIRSQSYLLELFIARSARESATGNIPTNKLLVSF